ncbi:MAG TPA: hypothetical protein VGG48_11175 [Rhizomicrobium sp.]|jgi:hypothetical protein
MKTIILALTILAGGLSAAGAHDARVPSSGQTPGFVLSVPDDWNSQSNPEGNYLTAAAPDHSAAIVTTFDAVSATPDEYANVQFNAAKGVSLVKGAPVTINGFSGFSYTFDINGQPRVLNVRMIVLKLGGRSIGSCSIITTQGERDVDKAAGNAVWSSLRVVTKP